MRAKLTLTLEDPGTGASTTETRPILILLYEADGTLKGETEFYLDVTEPREKALRQMFRDEVDRIEKELPKVSAAKEGTTP